MSDSSSHESEEEIEFIKIAKRLSIKLVHPKTDLNMDVDLKTNKKRSSSASVYLPKNFVPKLKPIIAKICPSPIILNEKSPPKITQEIQNTTMSTSSFDSKHEFKKIRIKIKKSIKLINEKVYSFSDCEDMDKKQKNDNLDSDSSKNGEENEKNVIKLRSKNKNKINAINKMRIRMTHIRKNSLKDKNIFDDSSLRKNLKEKTNIILKHIQNSFANEIRYNKHRDLYSINSAKNRTRSHNTRTNYIPTILGFLERNKSSFSLNSMGK